MFDLVEILIESVAERQVAAGSALADTINRVFQGKNVAFGVADGLVLPLPDELERRAVEGTLAATTSYPGPREQLTNASNLLRTEQWGPSIAASINEVEGAARSVLGDDNIVLSRAIAKLKAEERIDPSLANAWQSFYSYASNADNIRHDGRQPVSAERNLAAYFLVTASAFVSYLLSLPEVK